MLSRRANTGWRDNELCVPGGHVESGETPKQAAIRELEEEIGLQITTDDLVFVAVAARQSSNYECVAYVFLYKLANRKLAYNNEPELCSEVMWVDPHALPPDTIPDCAAMITRGYLEKLPYLELGYS